MSDQMTQPHHPKASRAGIIAPEGVPIVAVMALLAAALAGGLWFLSPWAALVAGIIGIVIVGWALWFFRDPERTPPTDPHALICGADGVVSFIGPSAPPAELGLSAAESQGLTRVSIFMNIFNVHVNRVPGACTVERIHYRPGAFFNASLDKASEQNERLSLVLRLDQGRRMIVVQIAGLIARRIVCRVKEGARLGPGERFGLIRFGSRVDHYLPAGVEPMVRPGQRTFAGQTVLARLPHPATAGHDASPAPALAREGAA